MRRADLLAVAAAAAIVLATLAGAALARERPAHIERVAAATGALALSNTREGAAIFTASRMTPGQAIGGTLTLGNTGEQAGRLMLSRARLTETPGPGGGRLSDVLTLRVDDITTGTPREVVSGELGGLSTILLHDLPGGATRTYRFTIAFPDGGPHGADNAYAGASLRVDYEWLTEAIAPTPTPTAEPQVPRTAPGTVPPPAAPVQPAGRTPNNPALAPRLALRIPHQRVMHTDFVRVFARCSERCSVRFAGRATTAPRRGKARVLRRRGLFRGERRARVVRVRREHAVRLRLTPAGRAVLRRTLDARGRVGVVITATVRGSRGTRKVRKRIVLHTTLIRNGKRISFRY
jgi:hypothetical protein